MVDIKRALNIPFNRQSLPSLGIGAILLMPGAWINSKYVLTLKADNHLYADTISIIPVWVHQSLRSGLQKHTLAMY
jgi:hypothetical protein